MWIWSFGAVASEGVAPMRIDVVSGSVERKHASEAEFAVITGSVDVQTGDEVRTGSDGSAEIVWGDRGVTRIDPGTTLTIENAPEDPLAATHVVLKLHMESGRTWSRLLKLLDADSAAEVRTDSVVATVRGTAFGVAVAPSSTTEIAVTESVVSADGSASSTLVREGSWGSFHNDGVPNIVRSLLPTDAWAVDNKALDEKFDEGLRQDIAQRFKKRLVSAPSNIVDVSESLHLAFEKDENRRQELLRGYLGRRIARAIHRPEDADRILNTKLPVEWSELSPETRQHALLDIRYALFLETPRPGYAVDQGLVDALRKLRALLLGEDPKNAPFADALSIDDDIDSFLFSGDQKTENRRTDLLNAIESLDADSDEDKVLDGKLDAMRLRLQLAAGEILPTQIEPEETEDTTGDPRETGTTKPPTSGEQTSTPTTTKPTEVCGYQNLQLETAPSVIDTHSFSTLTLTAQDTCSLQQHNVTGETTFKTESPDTGTFRGNVFYPSRAATVAIIASINDHGVTKSTKAYVTVKQGARRPVSVSVTTAGSVNLTTGQSAPLEAQVSYDDGSKAFVTPQCTWSTTDQAVGIIQSTKFTATKEVGSADAVCIYTENGTNYRGTLTFTVNIDPSLQPTGGKPKPPRQTY
jgi:hypothetical protein